MMRERQLGTVPGLPMALLFFVLLVGLVYTLNAGADARPVIVTIGLGVLTLLDLLLFVGLFVVNPNEARVLQLFGDYVGTGRRPRACGGQTPSTPRSGSRSACETPRVPA